MTSQPDPGWDDYKSAIVEAANRTGAQMNGCGIEALRLLVIAYDVVFGVWQDRREPDGVGLLLIKGAQAMREVVASQQARAVTLTAIPVHSIEEAEAMRLTIGEADLRH